MFFYEFVCLVVLLCFSLLFAFCCSYYYLYFFLIFIMFLSFYKVLMYILMKTLLNWNWNDITSLWKIGLDTNMISHEQVQKFLLWQSVLLIVAIIAKRLPVCILKGGYTQAQISVEKRTIWCHKNYKYFSSNGPAKSFFQRWFKPVWIGL